MRKIRDDGYKGPLLIRFPHLIKKQLNKLFSSFKSSIKQYKYKGAFKAVFPLKVNQFPNFVLPLVEASIDKDYGLEAGSKAELIVAMAYTNLGSPITVNGFKDKEMINLGFIASNMGHNITLTIEGLNELKTIIAVAKEMGAPYPNIGIRIRLHSMGSGIWAKSGGINAKFGLTSTELLEAVNLLKKSKLISQFSMIHFHIARRGSAYQPVGNTAARSSSRRGCLHQSVMHPRQKDVLLPSLQKDVHPPPKTSAASRMQAIFDSS